MAPKLLTEDDDNEYYSAADSDYAPDDIASRGFDSGDDGEGASEADVEMKNGASKGEVEAEDVGMENSGDEAIVEKGLRRERQRGRGKGTKGVKGSKVEDEGGPGGWVKTRRQRALEKFETKFIIDTSAPTVDIDAIFARLKSGAPPPPLPPDPSSPPLSILPRSQKAFPNHESQPTKISTDASSPSTASAFILIKRTYTFAGKLHTEEKLVPRTSAEAKLYLSQTQTETDNPSRPPDAAQIPLTVTGLPKRTLPLLKRSVFEPVENVTRRQDLFFAGGGGGKVRTGHGQDDVDVEAKTKNLNTVEKSKLDWAGFVDKEGIGDELDQAGKGKGAYRERVRFLERVEGRREVGRRGRGVGA